MYYTREARDYIAPYYRWKTERREEASGQRASATASTKMKLKEFVTNSLPRTRKQKKKTSEVTNVPKSQSDDLCSRHLSISPELPTRHTVVSYDSLLDASRQTPIENFNYLNDKTQYLINNVDLNNLSGDKCGRYKTISPCISPHFMNRKQPALTPLRLTCITDSQYNTVPRIRSRIKTNPWLPSPRASPVTSTDSSPYTSQVTSPVSAEDKLERFLSSHSTPTSDLPPSPNSLSQSSSSDSMKDKNPIMSSFRARRDSLDSTPSTTDSDSLFHRSFNSETDNYSSANDTFQTISPYTIAIEHSDFFVESYPKQERNSNGLGNLKTDDIFEGNIEAHPLIVDLNVEKCKRNSWRGSRDTLVATNETIPETKTVNYLQSDGNYVLSASRSNLDNMFCSMTESGFDECDSDDTVQDEPGVLLSTPKILNKGSGQDEYKLNTYGHHAGMSEDQTLTISVNDDGESLDLSLHNEYDSQHFPKPTGIDARGIDWEKMQDALYNLQGELDQFDGIQEHHCDLDRSISLEHHCDLDRSISLEHHCDLDRSVSVEHNYYLDRSLSVDEETEKLFNDEYDSMVAETESQKSSNHGLGAVQGSNRSEKRSRNVHQVKSSLQEKVYRLRKEKELVDKKIREAQEEERVRLQEKMRLKKQMTHLRKQILLRTLQDLKNKLENQSDRLQTSYNKVVASEWQRARTRRKLTEYIDYDVTSGSTHQREAPF